MLNHSLAFCKQISHKNRKPTKNQKERFHNLILVLNPQYENKEDCLLNKPACYRQVYEILLYASRIFNRIEYAYKTIARKIDYCERHVQRIVRYLEKTGLIGTLYRHMKTLVYKVYGSLQQHLQVKTSQNPQLAQNVLRYNLIQEDTQFYWGEFTKKLGQSIIAYEQVNDSGGRERKKMNASEFIFLISSVI